MMRDAQRRGAACGRPHLGIAACVIAAVVIVLVTAAAPAFAPATLEDLPGYATYERLRQQQRELSRLGRIDDLEWTAEALRFTRDGERLRFDFATRTIEAVEEAQDEGPEDEAASTSTIDGRAAHRPPPARGHQHDTAPSPDGQWTAVCREWNVVLERTDTGDTIAVTTDGTRKQRYGKASWVYGEELGQHDAMWWSPDSKRFVFYAFDEREVPDFHLTGNLTDRYTDLRTEGYPKAGDPNPVAGLMLHDLHTGETTALDVGPEREQYIYAVRFSPDGRDLLLHRTNRLQNVLELVAIDLETLEPRIILTETQATWQENRPELRFLDDGRRFIWQSERTGWAQYELRSLDDDRIVPLTRGPYPVDSIVRVEEDDEGGGVLYHLARSDDHPLNLHLHRVNLDGSGAQRLTREPAVHRVWLSDDARWFVTRYGTVQQPPTTALYATDGERIATLAHSSAAVFAEHDLTPPELFTCTAADGETTLYGLLYKPPDFDPTRRYPLVVDVYGGPHLQRVRNTWRPVRPETAFGFLVAVIDNRGTPGRGKAFQSATYRQLGIVDLADQAAAVEHLAARPYVDPTRIGIYGSSYGGYLSALAILKYPHLFHVAVAASAVTDWRNYDTIYTERYMGLPAENEANYDAGSALTYADQLRGRLLIQHGMVDDNVHPNNAWQLIDALQDAGRPFDMILYPDRSHRLGRDAVDARWLYFHQHLIASPGAPVVAW